MKYLFTHHQVSPSFLDYLFPFGKQIDARDVHFSGIKDESRFASPKKGAGTSDRGRTGVVLQLCYNLRSVESSSSEVDLPWSIRQTAVYQTLDTETGQALWIIVKGSPMMKKRITEASKDPSWASTTSPCKALTTVLSTHILICDWSREKWRWYLNDLEHELQLVTGNVLANDINKDPTPNSSPGPSVIDLSQPPDRSHTLPSFLSSKNDRAVTNKFSSRSATAPSAQKNTRLWPSLTIRPSGPGFDNVTFASQSDRTPTTTHETPTLGVRVGRWLGLNQNRHVQNLHVNGGNYEEASRSFDVEKYACSPTTISTLVQTQPQPTSNNAEDYGREKKFTFSDLQRIEYLEEKAHEVHLVLKQNTEILEELRQHYQMLVTCKEFPTKLKIACQEELARFDSRIVGIRKDLQQSNARTETFLHHLQNRKNLLLSILQYRSMRASELLAKKAQVSAKNMEGMTEAMWDVARKTEQETVSMRVITSVTLFFLPATFIATFMSTNILRFEDGKRQFEIGGLKVYLLVAMPLTFLTFLTWFLIYHLAKQNRKTSS
ncbi:hypothetical protein T440DRAFT_391296 [Plenodomus tracheiphilus IPT5]|uniref:CorA-like transporter domain-containing protein n=1 Tax=Plenodomus tracheiphilus IPT5 TaxID=1408161 RepID=A0A6A7BB58_9PLEO|nr:hypothetical protein T440DRAFT_391296 [Plenodomus tracheiphilus IPT5]